MFLGLGLDTKKTQDVIPDYPQEHLETWQFTPCYPFVVMVRFGPALARLRTRHRDPKDFGFPTEIGGDTPLLDLQCLLASANPRRTFDET